MIGVNTLRVAAAVAAGLAAAGGCSKSASAPSSTLTCSTLPNATTFLLLNNAVCPQTMTVAKGTRVTFINNDTRTHDMESDPHPEHTDCPELNQVGVLQPGQQRDSGNLNGNPNTAKRCGFHDHLNDTNAALQGAITIP
jgi:plastocyanin